MKNSLNKETKESEIKQQINEVAYKILSEMEDNKRKREELDLNLEKLDKKLTEFLEIIWKKIDLASEQGLDTTQIIDELEKVRTKEKDANHLEIQKKKWENI